MELDLTFITPLWTADATGKARYVEGTGLMGSLRWWYEALIRGLGGWACDPTGEGGQCALDGGVFKRRYRQGCAHAAKGRLCAECEADALKESCLCPACQVFGATGWAKAFSIAINAKTGETSPPTGEGRQEAERYNPKTRRKSAFYFPPGQAGSVKLTLVSRRPSDGDVCQLILGLLEFIRHNAALAAKTNLGYGLFAWAQGRRPTDLLNSTEFASMVASQAVMRPDRPGGIWPDLREMFFTQVELVKPWKPTDFVNFKCDLRAAFRDEKDTQRQLRHFLLGKTKRNGAEASKIKMALFPTGDILRVWGWVPARLPGHARQEQAREGVMNLIHGQIKNCGTLSHWREFDSDRDTVTRCTDPQEYLQSLMEDER